MAWVLREASYSWGRGQDFNVVTKTALYHTFCAPVVSTSRMIVLYSYVVWTPFVSGAVPVANTLWYESRTHREGAASSFFCPSLKGGGGGGVVPGMGNQVLCNLIVVPERVRRRH
jgi:hypothetical protein